MEEMRWVFDKFDANKDGKISREEYKLAQRALNKGIPETELVKLFQTIDSDGDGFIDFKEFMEMFNVGGGVKATELGEFRVPENFERLIWTAMVK
jgi:calcium-binding protein CML